MTQQKVNYEPSVDAALLEHAPMDTYRKHGLEALLTCVPPFLLTTEVVEFYTNFRRNRDGSVTTTVTIITSTGEQVPFSFDVRAAVRSLFSLPHEGDSISTLTAVEVGATMTQVIFRGEVSSTIYLRDIKDIFKMAIKVMKQTFIGMLGSRNQTSFPQQRLLTALFGVYSWNWEEAFLNILLEAAKSPKIRLGCKVSDLIAHATKDEDTTWPTQQEYTLTLFAPKETGRRRRPREERLRAGRLQPKPSQNPPPLLPLRILIPTPTLSSTSLLAPSISLLPLTLQLPQPPKTSKWRPIPRPKGECVFRFSLAPHSHSYFPSH